MGTPNFVIVRIYANIQNGSMDFLCVRTQKLQNRKCACMRGVFRCVRGLKTSGRCVYAHNRNSDTCAETPIFIHVRIDQNILWHVCVMLLRMYADTPTSSICVYVTETQSRNSNTSQHTHMAHNLDRNAD